MDPNPSVPCPYLSFSGGKPLSCKVNVSPSPPSSVFHRKQNLPIKLLKPGKQNKQYVIYLMKYLVTI